MTWRDEATPTATPSAPPSTATLSPLPYPVPWPATRVADAVVDFTAFLDARVFAGTVVWVSTPRTRETTPGYFSNYARFNDAIEALDAAVGAALRARGVPIIDMRRFADGVQPGGATHVDAVHPPVAHYDAVVHALGRAVCPAAASSDTA